MEPSSVILVYRYCLFGMSSILKSLRVLTNALSPQVIVIISNAIVCSAAAGNLPVLQNADLHGKITA